MCIGFWRLLVVREGRRTTWLPCPTGEAADAPPTFATLDWRGWWVDTSTAPSWRASQTADNSGQATAGGAGAGEGGHDASTVQEKKKDGPWDADVGPTLAGVVQAGGTLPCSQLTDAPQPAAPPSDEVALA